MRSPSSQAANGAGKFLAGGHSLVPLMKLRLSEPQLLIDIARIPGAGRHSREGRQDRDRRGTVHHDVATSALLAAEVPGGRRMRREIGDPQVRNRGTLGGSLAHADPSADYPAVMLALDAEIHLKGPKGWRVVKAQRLLPGSVHRRSGADEIIVGVQFAPVKSAAYAKLHQRASHYAIVGVAAALEVERRHDRVGAGRPDRRRPRTRAGSPTSSRRWPGKPLSDATIEAAAAIAGDGLGDVNADIHASEEYRRAMIPVFTRRALTAAMARA